MELMEKVHLCAPNIQVTAVGVEASLCYGKVKMTADCDLLSKSFDVSEEADNKRKLH